MRYVALISHGPRWRTGRSVFEQGPAMQDHLEAMRRRFDEGSLLLGGPFDGKGGIAVLDAPDEDAAADVMDTDPGVVAGVLTYELHHLNAYFDAFAGVRAEETVAELRWNHGLSASGSEARRDA